MHAKLESIDGAKVGLRGQTAGVGIRLNPKLANNHYAMRGQLAS